MRLPALFILFWTVFAAGSSARAEYKPDLGAIIAKTLPGYRLVADRDYVDALKKEDRGRSWAREDFDGDGKKDWAVLVISRKARQVRAYFLIATDDGYRPDLLFKRRWKKGAKGGVVRTPMFLKRRGDPGLSDRTYNSLTNDAEDPKAAKAHARTAAAYKSVPAVELWTGQNGDERDQDAADMSWCSETWYYDKGKLKSFGACD